MPMTDLATVFPARLKPVPLRPIIPPVQQAFVAQIITHQPPWLDAGSATVQVVEKVAIE